MSELKIAVDLDGVLAEAMIAWCELYNKRYGQSMSIEDIRAWNVWKIVKISRDAFFRILDDAWLEWEKIPPTEGDVGGQVMLLHEFGKVDVVTGRSPRTVPHAKEWLKAYSVPYRRFVRTDSTLAKIRLDYDVFVDDSPALMELIARKSRTLGILYTRPWNRDVNISSVIQRANSWTQIPPIVGAAKEARVHKSD